MAVADIAILDTSEGVGVQDISLNIAAQHDAAHNYLQMQVFACGHQPSQLALREIKGGVAWHLLLQLGKQRSRAFPNC
jgi:hypothetical protein